MAVTALLLIACDANNGTPASSSGPAFFEAGRIRQEACGEDVCVSQDFANGGNEPGSGECQLFKLDFLQSHREAKGPGVILPTVQPGQLTTVTARWPQNEVADRNVFDFKCEPGPLM